MTMGSFSGNDSKSGKYSNQFVVTFDNLVILRDELSNSKNVTVYLKNLLFIGHTVQQDASLHN
jgi:hypothetical protein